MPCRRPALLDRPASPRTRPAHRGSRTACSHREGRTLPTVDSDTRLRSAISLLLSFRLALMRRRSAAGASAGLVSIITSPLSDLGVSALRLARHVSPLPRGRARQAAMPGELLGFVSAWSVRLPSVYPEQDVYARRVPRGLARHQGQPVGSPGHHRRQRLLRVHPLPVPRPRPAQPPGRKPPRSARLRGVSPQRGLRQRCSEDSMSTVAITSTASSDPAWHWPGGAARLTSGNKGRQPSR